MPSLGEAKQRQQRQLLEEQEQRLQRQDQELARLKQELNVSRV